MPHWRHRDESLARLIDPFEDNEMPEPDNIYWWTRIIAKAAGWIAAMCVGALFTLLVVGLA
jgi:hypothetical protein